MRIEKSDFVKGAQEARGTVVIIDVFRAFSTACYCYQQGAETVFPVGSVEEAKSLARQLRNSVLVGERGGRKISGFDCGNSPSEISGLSLIGKKVILTTHAGTQGLVNAVQADELFTGALVNARATAEYIRERQPYTVTLVRMGWKAEQASDEDTVCAEYLESLLLMKEYDSRSIPTLLKNSPCSDRFFDEEKPWSPPEDFAKCLEIDRFTFALKVEVDHMGRRYLQPVGGDGVSKN